MLNLVLILDRKWRAKNVHGIGTKLVSNWGQNMSYKKSWQSFCREKMSMLTGLKVSSLACKCVFYRPEHNGKERETPWN